MSNPQYDWKKHATQMGGTAIPEEIAIERAVMDQAYGAVAQKAGPLMEAPYRIGFEIVYKNDSNTRIVGVFAFRIDKELLYVPIFFLNGEIKGSELLYRVDSKSFVPLTPEWVEFLMGRGSQEYGRGISKTHRKNMPSDVEFDRIAHPPASHYRSKMSSVLEGDELAEFKKFAKTCVDEFERQVEIPKILERFMREDGGVPAMKVIEKWAEASEDFVENLVNHTDFDAVIEAAKDNYLDREAKKASKERPTLEVFFELDESMTEEERATLFKSGAVIRDTRGDAEGKLGVVYEAATKSLEGISGPGLYDVVMAGGDLREAFAAPASTIYLHSNRDTNNVTSCCDPSWDRDHACETVLVFTDGDKASKEKQSVFGKLKKDLSECLKDSGIFTKEPKTNKAYRVFDEGTNSITDPFYVLEKKNGEDGIKLLTVVLDNYEPHAVLKINPEWSESDYNNGVLGSRAHFIEVGVSNVDKREENDYRIKYECDVDILPASQLTNMLYNGGLDQVEITKRANEFQVTSKLNAFAPSPWMDELTTKIALAKELAIPAVDAVQFVDNANLENASSFFYEKAARNGIYVEDEPDFDKYFDSFFGVDMDPGRSHVLETDTDFDYPAEQRVGDALDPGSPNGLPRSVLATAAPEELEMMGQMQGLSSLFEHDVVGSLVHTYDSAAMIDKYIPDFEKALDGYGRILFLFFWKPGDFSDAYGTDDMTNLENKISSIFRSSGDLVLDLLKKSRRRKEVGNVTMSM